MFETTDDSRYRKTCTHFSGLLFSARSQLLVLSAVVLLAGCASQRELFNESVIKRVGLPGNTDAFRNRWYAGAAVGSSRLDPDLSDVSFTLQQGTAVGTQFRLGYDFHSLFSLEVDSSVLGGAELESTAEVEYTSFAVSGLVYALAGKANRSRRQKWSAFGRFGLGLSSASSNVAPLDGRDLSGVVLGLGVEYGFANGLGLRFEATRLHDEAIFAGLGAVYRFGGPGSRGILPRLAKKPATTPDIPTSNSSGSYYGNGSAVAGTQILPEPGLQAGLPGVFQQDAHPSHRADTTPRIAPGNTNQFVGKVVVATAHDLDADGVSNEADECANTPNGTSVNSDGCGLFDGVVEGVTFKSGSAGLDLTTKRILDRLAVRLLAFPEIRVEVQAHTDGKGPESINESVSQSRAAAVVRYLQSSGVDSKQLEAVGMGETRPRADNDSELGRLSNRRIELKTLPDLDIVPRHVTVVSPAMEVIQLNSSAASVERLLNSKKKQTVAAKSAAANSVAASSGSSAEPTLGAALAAPIEALPALIELPGTSFNGILDEVDFVERTATLSDSSKPELDVIARQLKQHDKARIAIMAHTDDGGDESANMKLTVEQAQAVAGYLQQQGIAANRLETEGYGSDLPLAQNVTESDRALNRRIELRLIAR